MRRLALFCLLWFAAGYTAGLAVTAITVPPIPVWGFGVACLLLGLIILAAVLRTEDNRRLFYEGPAEHEEDSEFIIGCLWVIPGILFVISFVAWLVFLL